MADIGIYIRELRRAKNYSARKLAMVTGVSHATISRLEAGLTKPNLETLKKLSPYLGVNYSKLLEHAGYLDENSGTFYMRDNSSNGFNREHVDVLDHILDHIKDKPLRDWISSPASLQYLKFAKSLYDLGIDPKFVYDGFVSKIFRKKS